jgi:hypothetical protein
MPKKPNANTKEYWTPRRRKEHSQRMVEWNDHDRPDRKDYYDPKKKDWIDGAWTPEMRKKKAEQTRNVWKKKTKKERELISAKLKLYHLERRFEALNGRKPPYKWVFELRRLNALVR